MITTLRRRARPKGHRGAGFTLIELIVAIVIISTMLLGIGAVIPGMIQATATSGIDFLTLNAVEDRIAMIQTDPRYTRLDSIYGDVEDDLPGLPGFERRTEVTRTIVNQPGGRTLDTTEISVLVIGDAPPRQVGRTIVLGAP